MQVLESMTDEEISAKTISELEEAAANALLLKRQLEEEKQRRQAAEEALAAMSVGFSLVPFDLSCF